jgi:U3 small nucleolar RNA-associated protein 20
LPITLLNLPTIFQILSDYYRSLKDGEDHLNSGLESALSLHLALYATCLSEGAAYLPITMRDLIRVGSLRALEPKLIEKAFSILSEILRMLASTIVKPDEASQDILRATWKEVTPYLRLKENKQYVRKCVSDACIGVLRKARGDGLERLIGVLLEEPSEGMEAVWAGSMKGTQGQLHSRALPLFEILLRRTLEKEGGDRVHMLEMVLISLAHYCSAATLAPITIALVTSLQNAASAHSITSTQTSLLRLTSALLFTRKGKRFVDTQIKPTMTTLLGMADQLGAGQTKEGSKKDWTDAYVEAVIASLMAGKLEHWLSPGVTLIDKACKELVSQTDH